MPSFKNIRLKMKGGKSRLQRVQVLASGKYKFVKNKGSRSTKLTKTSKKSTIRRKIGMVRKRGRRGSKKFTLPIAPLAGLAAGLIGPIDALVKSDYDYAVELLCANYTGYSFMKRNWVPDRLMRGLVPLVIGGMVHKFVGGAPLNLNRMLANAGVPIVRI